MGAFTSSFLIQLENNKRNESTLHASLEQNFSFVPLVTAPPGPPASVPTQQIVIVSASICEVSFGGR